jgi:hypothetical protein
MDSEAAVPSSSAPSQASKSRRKPKRPRIAESDAHALVEKLFEEDLHARRVLSVSHCVLGVLHGASLAIHAIGQGLASARGLDPKHAIKQVDRLLRNRAIDVPALQAPWVRFLAAERTEFVVTFDWTEFDADDQSTIALNMVTTHGRATPLLWKTVRKSELKDRRNEYEDDLLRQLRDIVPMPVKITVLADRGFGDQKLYDFMRTLRLDFVIRFREGITVTDEAGRAMPASEWVPVNGHAKSIRNAKVTVDGTPVPMVVCTKARGMKDAWCLATSRSDLGGPSVVKMYGKRFTTEENFRDTKDMRYGLGLSATHIKDPLKRDRLLLICALAQALLTLLGAAAERVGLDRRLKASTTKKRTHSLFRQGLYWYGAIPMMRDDLLEQLLRAFAELLREHDFFRLVLGPI